MTCVDADRLLLSIKSTIDKMMFDVTNDLLMDGVTDIRTADLDDVQQTSEVLGGDMPAVVYQFQDAAEEPRDPLWRVNFMVGAKTTADSGNYKLHRLHSRITSLFPVGSDFKIMNYAQDSSPSVVEAIATVVDTEVLPQQFDQQAGIRISRIGIRVMRL